MLCTIKNFNFDYIYIYIITNQLLVYIFQKIESHSLEDFFGLTTDVQKNSECGYILFYESRRV